MFSTGPAEIVLIVEDVERSARFYRDVVGLVPENEPDDGAAWSHFRGPDGNIYEVTTPARPGA